MYKRQVLYETQDFLTANEGATREYGDYEDEIRAKDLAEEFDLDLDSDAAEIYKNKRLGRLQVRRTPSYTLTRSTI